MATIDSDSIPIPIPTPTPRVAPNRPAVRGKPKPRLLGVVDYSGLPHFALQVGQQDKTIQRINGRISGHAPSPCVALPDVPPPGRDGGTCVP